MLRSRSRPAGRPIAENGDERKPDPFPILHARAARRRDLHRPRRRRGRSEPDTADKRAILASWVSEARAGRGRADAAPSRQRRRRRGRRRPRSAARTRPIGRSSRAPADPRRASQGFRTTTTRPRRRRGPEFRLLRSTSTPTAARVGSPAALSEKIQPARRTSCAALSSRRPGRADVA